jgi:ribosomal protein L9
LNGFNVDHHRQAGAGRSIKMLGEHTVLLKLHRNVDGAA